MAPFVTGRNFGTNFVERRFGDSFHEFINKGIPVIEFLTEHFTAHCLFRGVKQSFKRHKPDFFMDLPPKHFKRIL